MVAMPAYARPTRLTEALALLGEGERAILAGGTDHYPARVGRPLNEDILDLTAVRELRGITAGTADWRIGATTTWTDVLEAKLPPLFEGLKLAAREVGGVQIQNSGTVAGNLCNASPAADGVPPLLALDATIEITGTGGKRTLPLEQFIVGPRKTALRPGEIVTAIVVPKPKHAAKSDFLKLGARTYLVISIAMVAIVLEHEDGSIRTARVAVGSCSPVARRLPALEQALVGRPLAHLSACVQVEHLEPLAPIDDVRGSGGYRKDAVFTLIRRSLERMT